MFHVEKYYQTARENEEIFRNILRDLRDHRLERPMGGYIPHDLETELQLEEIFDKYSEGSRTGRFTITSFMIHPQKNKARIGFKDIAPLSGGGAKLEYLVKEDNSIQYQTYISMVRS